MPADICGTVSCVSGGMECGAGESLLEVMDLRCDRPETDLALRLLAGEDEPRLNGSFQEEGAGGVWRDSTGDDKVDDDHRERSTLGGALEAYIPASGLSGMAGERGDCPSCAMPYTQLSNASISRGVSGSSGMVSRQNALCERVLVSFGVGGHSGLDRLSKSNSR